MDTPGTAPLPSRSNKPPLLPRWLRVSVIVCLILLVQGMFAYLLTWVDPPREPAFIEIRVAQSRPDCAADPHHHRPGTLQTKTTILDALASLSTINANQPAIVHVSAPAVQAESGSVYILPDDATLGEPSGWLPLREVLGRLRDCRSSNKLLVLDLAPPRASAWRGYVYHDLGAAIPRELDAVPDADRLVLCAHAAGQTSHGSAELGRSVFDYYFDAGKRGHADGHGDQRDGRVNVAELAAFVQARVARWTVRVRGGRQTPVLLGTGRDFAIASVDSNAAHAPSPALAVREHSALVQHAWKQRDDLVQADAFRLTPRAFQQRQARLQMLDRLDAAGVRSADLKNMDAGLPPMPVASSQAISADSRKASADVWRGLKLHLAFSSKNPEHIKKLVIEEVRGKLPADDLDAVVFAHLRSEGQLDPGTLRLCDALLHPTPQTAPRSAEALCIRQLADLAMRVEVVAWPTDLVDTLLRATEAGERAHRQTPWLPGYVDLLDEPALARHSGEVRLWTRGFANPADARVRLADAAQKFEQLSRLNDRWHTCEKVVDETLAELPWYFEAMETLTELRSPWEQTAASARALADILKTTPDDKLPWQARVDRLAAQVDAAEKAAQALQKHRQAMHVPFAKDALARLERQCRSPQADAQTLREVEALLSVVAPVLQADDRARLWRVAHPLSRRLHEEILALDRQDDDAQRRTVNVESSLPAAEDAADHAARRARCQLSLLRLAGVAEDRLDGLQRASEPSKQNKADPAHWCELGKDFHQVMSKAMPEQYRAAKSWRERERLAWLMSPWDSSIDAAGPSPTMLQRRSEQDRQASWLRKHRDQQGHDYRGIGFDSPGIVAARTFHDSLPSSEPWLRMNVAGAVAPLSDKQPYADVELEVTRVVPPGAFGPVELKFHRPDDVWLEIAPDSATLPALAPAREARTLTHKVPLRVVRQAKAERTGLPPPLGFLIEARFEGHSYHRVVAAPIMPSTQELQILVSADPDEPATTIDEIRVRPGKVKQPHYVYVKNLTNRPQKLHVEIRSGSEVLHKSAKLLTLPPDGVRKVQFEEGSKPRELKGPLAVQVFDADRQKVLAERSLRVEVLSPRDYVKVAEATFEPGRDGNNKWAVHLQASRPVAGPAIAAQLVLPVQRIPGLLAVGGGTLKVELPTHAKSPSILFAERLQLVPSVLDDEGPVYLHIDGVPRAFVYRTKFTRTGEPTQPKPDERPAVRLIAPWYAMAGINCLVDVEVDNAPAGCKLEIALGRAMDDLSFKAEVVREFTHAKKHRIDLAANSDALNFEAAISDWTATFDTRAIVGPRAVRARLIDAAGKEIAAHQQAIVIDDTPPIARIVPTPTQVKKGSTLQVQAQGVDPESGIAQVVFFYGKPDKGEIPPSAVRFKAVPSNAMNTQWSATLEVPADHKGPLAVSVQVVNHAGLAAVDTVTLEVTDRDPGKTGLGEIRGKVVEGPRLQPNLTVTLLDERGKEVARTKTQADGTYVFTQIAPGRYRVVCVKPESQRRATLGVTVEPDRMARADLTLVL